MTNFSFPQKAPKEPLLFEFTSDYHNSRSCLGILTEPRSSSDKTLHSSLKRKKAQSSTCWRRQCSSSSRQMDNDISKFHSLDTKHSLNLVSVQDDKKLAERNVNYHRFINQAVITWNQMRREWLGDRSKRSRRRQREPSISWRTKYDDILSTSQPFPQPIPLSEMVDFLVDIWQEEGLYE